MEHPCHELIPALRIFFRATLGFSLRAYDPEKTSYPLYVELKEMREKAMKLGLFLLLISFNLWAKPLILVSYFDTFGKASFNNSEKVGLALKTIFAQHPEVDVRFCELPTIFDKSFYAWENCLKSLPRNPDLALGLGETGCNLKIEIVGRNFDKTYGPDNDGNERKGSEIIKDGPRTIGFTYPLEKMYCALDKKTRNDIVVSNDAGSFVCNNLAYQVANYYNDLSFGFIHVPSNHCRGLDSKNKIVIQNLERMILAGAKVKQVSPLPTTKSEIAKRREASEANSCENEFYKRAKGTDEKARWPF